jgi:hypothetical protein
MVLKYKFRNTKKKTAANKKKRSTHKKRGGGIVDSIQSLFSNKPTDNTIDTDNFKNDIIKKLIEIRDISNSIIDSKNKNYSQSNIQNKQKNLQNKINELNQLVENVSDKVNREMKLSVNELLSINTNSTIPSNRNEEISLIWFINRLVILSIEQKDLLIDILKQKGFKFNADILEKSIKSQYSRRNENESIRRQEQEKRRTTMEIQQLEQARLNMETESRLKSETEARLKDKKTLRKLKKTEEEARLQAELEARLKVIDEEARLKAVEEARLKAVEEARLKVIEDARLKVLEEARLKVIEEARLKVIEEARVKAEQEEAVILEFWLQFIKIDEINYMKNVLSDETSMCNFIHDIIPAYKVTDTLSPDKKNMLCKLLIILGFLSKKLENECTILFKGGKAIQLNSYNNPEYSEYISDDIDILIMNVTNKKYTPRFISEQIGKFIVWIINKNNKDILSLEDKKIDDEMSIYKISYKEKASNPKTSIYTAMVDINYKDIDEDIKRIYEFKGSNTIEFKYKEIVLKFKLPNITSLIMERIFFFYNYSSDTKLSKRYALFFDKIYKSLNYLLKVDPSYRTETDMIKRTKLVISNTILFMNEFMKKKLDIDIFEQYDIFNPNEKNPYSNTYYFIHNIENVPPSSVTLFYNKS